MGKSDIYLIFIFCRIIENHGKVRLKKQKAKKEIRNEKEIGKKNLKNGDRENKEKGKKKTWGDARKR